MEKNNKPRLFYVVELMHENAEIFETLDEAEKFANQLEEPYTITIQEVKNWYYEDDIGYSYDDLVDTFEYRVTLDY